VKLEALAGRPLTYSPAGLTRDVPTPAGFSTMVERRMIGRGPADFARAREGLLSWQMHRDAGLAMTATAARAAVGVESLGLLGIGSLGLAVPCRVVWAVEEERRAGFAYGTLPGHPEQGEEAFVVDLAADGAVWFTVRAVSRPAAWYMHAAGPLGRLGQRIFARRYVSALQRLAAGAAAG
jgi:uncharacterized protein (UPF0548 family)